MCAAVRLWLVDQRVFFYIYIYQQCKSENANDVPIENACCTCGEADAQEEVQGKVLRFGTLERIAYNG